jgi:hypothetical protein
MKLNQECLLPNLNIFQSTLMELIREGVLIISHKLQPTYLNLKANEICQKLWNGGSHYSAQLPPILSHISHQLIRNANPEATSFVMDYQIDGKQTIRIRASHLTQALDQEFIVSSQEQKYILVFLEDRNVTLEEELQIEQEKYGFTEREIQILNLLSQAYTYQEIAKTLQISLNTVKFHAKNIYAKKRSCLEQEKKMYS